jgi:amphiphysin
MYVHTYISQAHANTLQAFRVADDHIREALPPLVTAAFSILPHLLAVQIMIQNTLLAQYYTSLHNYCEDSGFPSPPPPMDDVIATWTRDFMPIKAEAESINMIARGKVVHQPMSLGDDGTRTLAVRNGLANRRASSQALTSQRSVSPNPGARAMRIPSYTVPVASPPAPSPTPSPEPRSVGPDYSTHLTPVSSYSAHSPAGPSADYFQRGIVQKKKPPPPPPKRIGSQNSGLYAIALYAFDGQGQGDLRFKEGDRIKVVKKTDSTDDWWEGELRGVKGSFPANYCKLA